jgi:hypothetical protein
VDQVTAERKNAALKLKYLDPRGVLTMPGALEEAVAEFGQSLSASDRRKLVGEMVQAAAFCFGMGRLWKRDVAFSPGEHSGADSIIRIPGEDGGGMYADLQVKQVPPEEVSPVGLQGVLDKLAGKYCDPEGLYVGIAVNRPGEIDFERLSIPPALRGEILELWIFGRLAEDRTRWFFRGDLLSDDARTWSVTIEDILPLE